MTIRGAALATVLAVAGLSGCSSGPDAESANPTTTTAAVCASADDLRASLSGLGDVRVVQQGTAALDQAWQAVQTDWADFADAARAEHSDEVDVVQADFDAVQTRVTAAQADPTAATLGALADDVATLLQDAGALVDEVSTRC